MKLKDIYKLDGDLVFGPGAPYYQDFSKSWFDDILELRFHTVDLNEEALAKAGRLTAVRLVVMGDGSGEYSSRVTKLLFDGRPFALHGESGDTLETHYLLVTDKAAYQEAEAHVRAHLEKPETTFYDVASEDDDHSLQALFGFYYREMADAARTRVQEAFGAEAAQVLGYEAPERNADYYLLKTQRLRDADRLTSTQDATVGYDGSGPPAQHISFGNLLYELTSPFQDEAELKIFRSVFSTERTWWTYRTVDTLAADAMVVRI